MVFPLYSVIYSKFLVTVLVYFHIIKYEVIELGELIFYFVLVIISVSIFLITYYADKKRTSKLKTDIVVYIDGSDSNAENDLKEFFNQSIWFDMTATRYIFLFNVAKSDKISELCKKYEKKYPNIKIWE